MQLRLEGSTRTVPVPDHDELRTGTLLSIIRQSQLPVASSNQANRRVLGSRLSNSGKEAKQRSTKRDRRRTSHAAQQAEVRWGPPRFASVCKWLDAMAVISARPASR
jgi:hypothetical protein